MRHLLFSLCLAGLLLVVHAPDVRAQEAGQSFSLLSSRSRPVEAWLGAGYQRFTQDGASIAQLSTPVGVRVPIGRSTQAQLTLSRAAVTGDDLAELSGLSDARLALSHARRIGEASVVAAVGVGLPTGRSGLTGEEFATSVEMGRNAYAFRVPGLGQGTSVAPSLVLALPLGDALVAGLGASFLYRGGFEPMTGMAAYDAGEEVLVTAGLSYRLGRVTALSGDVTYTRYGTDTVDGAEVFASGAKTTVLAQFRRMQQRARVHVYGLYRTRAVSQYRLGDVLAADESRTPPSQAQLHASYGRRLGGRLWTYVSAGARHFGATPTAEAMTLLQVGFRPEVQLSRELSLGLRLLGTFGDLQGLEAGTRITTRF